MTAYIEFKVLSFKTNDMVNNDRQLVSCYQTNMT